MEEILRYFWIVDPGPMADMPDESEVAGKELAELWNYCFLANGSMRARYDGGHYEFELSFLTQADAEQFDENLNRNMPVQSRQILEQGRLLFLPDEDEPVEFRPVAEVLDEPIQVPMIRKLLQIVRDQKLLNVVRQLRNEENNEKERNVN